MSFSSLFESGESARNRSHFASLVSIAQSSGLKDEESTLLSRYKSVLDINDSDYEEIMKDPSKFPVFPPNTSEERIQWLHDLFKIVFADHEMDETEHKLLKKYAVALGFNDEDATYLTERSIEIFTGHLSLEDYRYLLNKNR
ncbi:TerB family tellurite resistance protein [Nonlabens ponticola]|uniref:TerB family tellurite resistance protein n=1 Tax=Nonlabens ponticola TaxID=2496866 RepID=A0A3S9MWB8_9FLAO|nr:TerB family tellurite resistance protein [Nonlabens ponticola]AZQ43480.1 TerB family tellurite resistance protein [Nonlabens ponticola]